ncbi:dickkopf-related protein 1b [Amia ocellicauda]|uniref:dickkopf-related protein 1b n=1 Tax=Amia ocellicauda TaxID=2972642 RepID=UPI003463C50C|nr:DKK1 protein [Amia calva]
MHLPVPVLLAVCFALGGHCDAGLFNSNAIKNLPGGAPNPGHPVSASPDVMTYDSDNKNVAIDTYQSYTCAEDEECGAEEFCFGSRGLCLSCRKRRKRCARDAMCCPGNRCSNGVCLPADADATFHAGMEESFPDSFAPEYHSTVEPHPRQTTVPARPQTLKGQEGDVCLRSSDCSDGLCCARHFWSKICKPVLKEGQVCTRHRRKGTHGLEIFQRCDCGDGLACRTQKGDHSSKSSRLHTCQRH